MTNIEPSEVPVGGPRTGIANAFDQRIAQQRLFHNRNVGAGGAPDEISSRMTGDEDCWDL